VKTYLRESKSDGTTISKIDKAIRRGWRPGRGRVRDFIGKRRQREEMA